MRRVWVVARVLAVAGVAGACTLGLRARSDAAVLPCPTKHATYEYAASVKAAASSGRDVWGERLLASRSGPTLAGARQFLSPLLYAYRRKRHPLTPSGVYYLPLAYPTDVGATTAFALHVADGSMIITRHDTGPSLTIDVGTHGHERYGSCLGRLVPAKLSDGYLPILETSYTDSSDVVYHQESFAAHLKNAPSIVSFVHITADATHSDRGSVIRFTTSFPSRLRVDQKSPVAVAAGGTADVYAIWLNKLPATGPLVINAHVYAAARSLVAGYWDRRLSLGTQFDVPEPAVENAMKALEIEQIVQGWHYSVGNPYEELSFAEALDTAEVMAEYGYPYQSQQILNLALARLPVRYTSWRAGARLLADAVYFQLYRDRKLVDREAPKLSRVLTMIAQHQLPSGKLMPEPLCSDVADIVDGVPAQVVAWQGLLAMDQVWAQTGHPDLAARARTIAGRLHAALRQAITGAEKPLPDGSLFLPSAFDNPTSPYSRATSTRDGSYWNLVMPYVFASGFFAPHGREAKGFIQYLLQHGGRMLGVTRADAHIVYGYWVRGDGLGEAYGLSVSRFFADNDLPDQLTLSLYGQLAIGMTPDTFVSGEAVSVLPIGTRWYRTTYMPPNQGANSTYLETLRLMLIHERRGRQGAPSGLDLALSTPRAWLADGKTISVTDAPTSFGKLSYSLARTGSTVQIHLAEPPVATSIRLRLRLPLGEHIRVVRLGAHPLKVNRDTGTIQIPHSHAALDLTATIS